MRVHCLSSVLHRGSRLQHISNIRLTKQNSEQTKASFTNKSQFFLMLVQIPNNVTAQVSLLKEFVVCWGGFNLTQLYQLGHNIYLMEQTETKPKYFSVLQCYKRFDCFHPYPGLCNGQSYILSQRTHTHEQAANTKIYKTRWVHIFGARESTYGTSVFQTLASC